MEERFKKQMEFILEMDKMKNIMRQTYILDGKRKENDAEHSWHSAMMVILLSEHFEKDIDILKAVKMMMIHDIVEIYAGDMYCYDEGGNKDKLYLEELSADKIYGLLPDDQREEYISLWHEFEEQKTREAIFCAVVDRIQPMMLNYATGGKSWLEHGVYKEQVIERNKVTLDGPKVIVDWFNTVIEAAITKGYLK